ncbi:hypothetical protein PIROE2DRAFT_17892 [Piromyces sp. E2]|nr:hypothetical protein PIROE2DRAFT_17892 [Piromyces sp. E2]|eukprot:OUM57188.1 hypothetical protein PIROE2DRAFT_17892 [Piromyces sp. E2]
MYQFPLFDNKLIIISKFDNSIVKIDDILTKILNTTWLKIRSRHLLVRVLSLF